VDVAEFAARGREFDHVFFNPPFHPDTGQVSPSVARDRATRDVSQAVEEWTRAALALTRHGGTVTAIIRADREGDIREAAGHYGGIVFPFFPRLGQEPKRIIVRIVKSARTGFASAAGLVLHEADGRNTDAAEAVLRQGAALHLAIP
jgi:tRNA1(Val) A37 N6-methylase TrmN6